MLMKAIESIGYNYLNERQIRLLFLKTARAINNFKHGVDLNQLTSFASN